MCSQTNSVGHATEGVEPCAACKGHYDVRELRRCQKCGRLVCEFDRYDAVLSTRVYCLDCLQRLSQPARIDLRLGYADRLRRAFLASVVLNAILAASLCGAVAHIVSSSLYTPQGPHTGADATRPAPVFLRGSVPQGQNGR